MLRVQEVKRTFRRTSGCVPSLGTLGEELVTAPPQRRGRIRLVGMAAGLVGTAALCVGMVPAPAAAAPAISGYQYLTNFRTTHLSGRFVTPAGKPIKGAVVYLALNRVNDTSPEVQPMEILGETVTTAAGAFAFTVPHSAAVIDAATHNHGNVNLIMRAMTIPTVSAAAAPSPAVGADGTQAIGKICIPSTVITAPNCPAALNPPTPSEQDVINYNTQLPDEYSVDVATWAGAMIDPFNMYPNELVSTVDPVQNLTLHATNGVALLTGNASYGCVKTVTSSCPYDPVTIANAYPQEAVPNGGTTLRPVNNTVVGALNTVGSQTGGTVPLSARPPGEPSYCYDSNQWVQSTGPQFEPVTDMHANWDAQIKVHYEQSTTSSIGVSVHDDENGGSWTVDGNTDTSSSFGETTGLYGPYFAQRFDTYHDFAEIEHSDECDNGNYTFYYDWSEIDDQDWRGGSEADGSNLSGEDGPSAMRNYGNYTAPEDYDGNGKEITRTGGKGYKYGWEISMWGVTLGGETDWNNQYTETWEMGHNHGYHYLFGHDGKVTVSTLIFSN